MARAYSLDLRERLVAAVLEGRLSRRQAAERFEVSVSTAVKWVDRYQRTGSAAPGKMGGHKPKKIAGPHADWLRQRCREKGFTLRGLVRELAAERALSVDYRSVWEFVHAEGQSFKKDPDRQRTRPSGCRPASHAVDQSSGPRRSVAPGVHR